MAHYKTSLRQAVGVNTVIINDPLYENVRTIWSSEQK